MKNMELSWLQGFYENELTNYILPFWQHERCEDKEFGGYFNCFDNRGESLLGTDKYTWSQGRFVWIYSRMAAMETLFTKAKRDEFLRLAASGSKFLMEHCLLDNRWHCTYLMNRQGDAKKLEGWQRYDMSIYADCFVVLGLSQYALVSGERKEYEFAKKLYESIIERIDTGDFFTLPYPLSPQYRAHGIPMIVCNMSAELYRVSRVFDKKFSKELMGQMEFCARDILDNFADDKGMIHEVIRTDNSFMSNLLGQHANPGHSLEDAWFLLDAADILGRQEWSEQIFSIVKHTLQIGWDGQAGGILHYCGASGGEPKGDTSTVEQEPMLLQVQSGWNDKLWWVHSEALYITLRAYLETGDETFMQWHEKIFAYTFQVFPNPNREIREWIQILDRFGQPQSKTVALPVKDPYHIVRNLILLWQILENEKK